MRKTIKLMEGWYFTGKDDKEIAVDLPHTWNNIDGQDGGNDYYRGTCHYRKTFPRPDFDPESQRVYLEFHGVNASANVILNGKVAMTHDGGYSTFRKDVTDLLEAENQMVVSVDNSVNDRVYPQKADFTFYGGIYRDVLLVVVSKDHFDMDCWGGQGLKITPKVRKKDGEVRVETFHKAEGGKVTVRLLDAGGTIVAQGEGTDVTLPTRDQYIENYKQTICNLAPFGVKVICYNFMPVFDWTRTDLFHPVGDGSTALYYQKDIIQTDYKAMADYIMSFTEKYNMTFPGWEPERMAKLDELFKAYAPVTKEKLWENFKYFLEAIMPTCHECDIKMAVHMDDPPWDIFGLPRLFTDAEAVDYFLKMVDDPYNCLTLCTGSLNANPDNDCASIIRKHCDRIAFAHIRNIKHFPNGDFSEAAHRDCCGETGILNVLKAYHDCGYEGYIRPDHGRHLWGEGPGTVRPGYGLYDRALGVMYMLGVWDMLDKLDAEKK